MISQKPIAKKYAKAYLNVYQETITSEDLDNICSARSFLKQRNNFILLLCSVGVNRDETTQMLDKFCKHFNFKESLYKLVDVLKRHKHLVYLLEVLQDICALYKGRKKILELLIKTTVELDQQEIEKIEAFVESQTNEHVISSVQIDKDLIAGIRLQSNFYLWDHSIAGRLKVLQHKLSVEG